MNDFLTQPLEEIKGIGPYYLKKLEKLKIKTVGDLLYHFPFRYEDFSEIIPIKDATEGIHSFLAKVENIQVRRSFRKKMFLTEATLYDRTGKLKAIWFNQPYLTKSITKDSMIIVSGKVKKEKNKFIISSPVYEVVSKNGEFLTKDDINSENLKHTAGLIPVYPETKGLTSRGLRFLIKPLLVKTKYLKDFLPLEILKRNNLMDLKTALNQIHFPTNLEQAKKAKFRFSFEELFLLQLILKLNRNENKRLKAYQIPIEIEFIKELLKTLPFELTHSQKQALWEIIKDLGKDYPMNRLLNGDVGSGKTIVALIALITIFKNSYQGVLMAPTEILAQQHFETLKKFFKEFNLEAVLFISKQIRIYTDGLEGEIKRKALLEKISQGKPLIIIGTQALIQKDVEFKNLALVVIDEQHRFGVKQRAKLLDSPTNLIPHLLTMTATPIPRTLALGLWGDLDISFIKEMPLGRKKITSQLVFEKDRNKLYEFIRKRVSEKEQVFVICPRIEEKEELSFNQYLNLDTKAVKKEYEILSQQVFPDLRVGLLHGKLKSADKEEVMNQFKNGEIDILVSTSVVEVGIDVPNATIMVIEGAEKFGLSQLHQFRGRVGRGEKQSYCFLLVPQLVSKTTLSRLAYFTKIFDGFKLAQLDLKFRGPGEFLGEKQSGIPDLAMDGLKNEELVLLAKKEAEQILATDKQLTNYPLLKERLSQFQKEIHLE
jgi:ATP-dependent DNA helicase RecG